MAFPAAGTVPTTDTRSSVEIESPTLDAVDPANVDSGADIANRATNVTASGGHAASDAERLGALSGNSAAFETIHTFYKDPTAAADRLSELNPGERHELARGNLDVLGELRPDAGAQSPNGIDREVVGPGLAAYSHVRADNAATFEAAETRELDRATGREPGLDPASPDSILEPANEPGQSPSTSGQGGGLGNFMQNMNNAAASGGGQMSEKSPDQQMTAQVLNMRPDL